MTPVGQPERATQDRVISLFRDEPGYRYLGDWTDRDDNSNIDDDLLSAWLTESGYTPAQIGVAHHKLRTEADNHSRALYGNNQAVYSRLQPSTLRRGREDRGGRLHTPSGQRPRDAQTLALSSIAPNGVIPRLLLDAVTLYGVAYPAEGLVHCQAQPA